MAPFAKFIIKILIVPDGDIYTSPDRVTKLFTPDLKKDPHFWRKVPNLNGIEFVAPNIPDSEFCDSINHDYVRLMKLLELSDCETFVIYIRSTTTTILESNDLILNIYNLIEKYNNSNEDCKSKFDLFYLTKWVDRCDQYTVVGKLENSNVDVVETVRPNGLQAILFSPSGAERIKNSLAEPINYAVSLALTQLIADGTLLALTTPVSLMSYDVSAATKEIDYVKSHECANLPCDKGKPTSQGSNMSLFVFIVILIIVIAIFYFLITMVSKPKENYPTGAVPPYHHENIGTSAK